MRKQIVNKAAERTTIRHVAADAGVSVAAVSKVLRNAYGVSEVLRHKVETSIEKLNYRPSVAARGMRGRTYTIGVLVVELSNPFLAGVIESANDTFTDNNYKAFVAIGRSASTIEASMIESMIDNHMDGLLIVAPRISSKLIERFSRQIPIVAIAHHQQHALSYDTVNSDDRKGAFLATEALFRQGHRDIAMLSYDLSESPASVVVFQREIGYSEFMKQAGLEAQSRIIRLPFVESDRITAINTILSAPDRPRAMFVWSDLDGVPLLSIARTTGVRIPEDLAIVGYDNSPHAAIPLVGLASVDQNQPRLGKTAAEMLMTRIDGRKDAQHILIEPHVETRGSI